MSDYARCVRGITMNNGGIEILVEHMMGRSVILSYTIHSSIAYRQKGHLLYKYLVYMGQITHIIMRLLYYDN